MNKEVVQPAPEALEANTPFYDRAIPLLTMLLLLLCSPDVWYLRAPLITCCILGLCVRRWLTCPPLWYVITAFLGLSIYLNWESMDNHKYVMAYWSLTLCCAYTLSKHDQSRAMAISARLLIALCMLFSVLWKGVNPQYVDASFFEHTLLTDDRFDRLTGVVTGFSANDLATNQQMARLIVNGHLYGIVVNSGTLTSAPEIRPVAHLMTWWTIGIEALLALAFLLPNGRRSSIFRNCLLLLFAATTYSVATVRGFGWTLMLMGLAQCDDEHGRRFRPAYVAGFILIQLYTIPFPAVVRAISQLF